MKKALTLLLAALLVFSFAGCKGVQVLQTNAFVFGVITDEAGAPIEGATVTLIQGDKTAVDKDDNSFTKFTATTDAEGRYKLGEYETKEKGRQTISNGAYILEIVADGKITKKVTGNEIADLTVSELGVAMGLFGSFGNGPEYTDYYNENHTLKAPITMKGKLYAVKGGTDKAQLISNGSVAAGAKISAKVDPYGTNTTTTISSTVSDTGEYSLAGLYESTGISVMINYESNDVIYDITDALSIDSTGMADFTGANIVVNDRDAGTEFDISSDANLVIRSNDAITSLTLVTSSISGNYDALAPGTTKYSGVTAATNSAAPTFTFTYNKKIKSAVGNTDNQPMTTNSTGLKSTISVSDKVVTIKPQYPLFNNSTYGFNFSVTTEDGEIDTQNFTFTTEAGSTAFSAPSGISINADYTDKKAYVTFNAVSGSGIKYYVFAGLPGQDLVLMDDDLLTTSSGSPNNITTVVDNNTYINFQFDSSNAAFADKTLPFDAGTSYEGKINIGIMAVSGNSVSTITETVAKDNHIMRKVMKVDSVVDVDFYNNKTISSNNVAETNRTLKFDTQDFKEAMVDPTVSETIADTDITVSWVWEDTAKTKGHISLTVPYSSTGAKDGIIVTDETITVTFTKDIAGNDLAYDSNSGKTTQSYSFQYKATAGITASDTLLNDNTALGYPAAQ